MNGRRRNSIGWQVVIIALAFICFAFNAQAAGLLSPRDGSLSPLKIMVHHVDVVIENGYAVTSVEQVFHNPHSSDLETVYSFPVPKKGAVAEFTM